MKHKSIFILAIGSFLGLLLPSCEKYLDVVPSETITSADVLGNIVNAEKIWANLYNTTIQDFGLVETGGYGGALLSACTDECKNHWESPTELIYNAGSWSSVNNPLDNWSPSYQAIRLANIFLENIDQSKIPEDKLSYYQPRIPGYKADARFMRAYRYFELFRRYGAVPLIRRSYDATEADEVLKITRSPVDSVVNFITSECDAAAEILPSTFTDNPSEIGRVTKGAALTLKAITLLYAASPLFNGNQLYAGVKNPDGTQLFPQAYDKNKWKLAADAAKAVLDLNVYSLFSPNPSNPIDNYAQLFYTREYNETILPLQFSSGRNLELQYLPNGKDAQGWGGHGKLSVFQTMVDAYEMSNGLPITDPNSGYSTNGFWTGRLWDGKTYRTGKNISNMYKDRDPRFYATIFFQYGYWDSATSPRAIKLAYYGGNGGNASDGWPKSGTNCETGYNWRKWSDPRVNPRTSSGNANRNYPIFRLPEMFLAYAEAMNEYEDVPTQDVYDAVNKVRGRVSMPNLPITGNDATKDGMRRRIRNEWRVEFAFENHRFWDVRRWLIGTQVDNGTMYGLNARPSQDELRATGLDVNSEAAGVAVFYKNVAVQTRVFLDKHYLFPIPQIEIDKNPNLIQNFGW
ncbi:MAG: hypothetical protein DI598_09840 [Pseudopedobacter saltans]|uniref:RagB/SusD family nutrient uptake outer membrane protein n=1 Tax=Pseudopedobacter saltans TaxID=151895 RepID=A0A2W5GS18_9SPHI|nr:MAG: hypothetical protein DI598_09840 [Pseudopedobacter saltans]